jgi:hypothetical protein
MPDRESIEKLLADLRRRREEAEAEAGHAASGLSRLVGGMLPVMETDTEQVRAAAETFVDAIGRLRTLDAFSRELRALLM